MTGSGEGNSDSGSHQERFRRVDSLFEQALELSETERARFLTDACKGDVALEQEVLALLRSVEVSESRFGENVAEFAPALISRWMDGDAAVDPPFQPGERVGPWRILHSVGGGGMGEVYRAERADGAFQLQAAVKVVKRGMDTAEVVRRFHDERKILATLQHPNIARVMDGGATDDGRPYLVMEYVEGRPVDEWCQTRELGVRDRVELFQRICEAVDQAHRRLIVHRDLKPSNVLVTEEGEPKLLDFGIAKLLELDDSVTRTGTRVLTPAYAAPEQLMGLPVTTATDVYGLGRLLYLLLAGGDPPGDPASRGEVEVPIPPPSTRAKGDRHLLRGDLDTIVLRALAWEPDRRYASALQLSEDLGRWLKGLPVQARPDSFRYRTGKFVRRNRGSVTMGALAVLLILGSTVALALSQRRTAQALAEAERERETAEEVASVLQGLFSAGNPMASGPERLDTLRAAALLERGEARVRDELGARPHVQARLFRSLGEVYRGMGRMDQAEVLLYDALALQRPLYRSGDTPSGLALAGLLHSLGTLELQRDGNALAEEHLREALALRRAYASDNARLLAATLANLASSLQNQDQFEDAAVIYQEAEEALELDPEPDRALLSNILGARSALADRLGDLATSLEMTERSLALDRELLGPGNWRVGLGTMNLGFLRQREGDLEESERLRLEGVEIVGEALGRDHPLYLNGLASLAALRWQMGRGEQARVMFEEALSGLRQREGPTENLAVHLSHYGDLLADLGELEGAERALREAVAIAEALGLGVTFGVAQTRYGQFLCGQGRRAEGLALYQAGLTVVAGILAEDHPRVVDIQRGLARCEEGSQAGN